jgi:transitional endoplasmic reticulum ATPase
MSKPFGNVNESISDAKVDGVAETYIHHSLAPRINTDIVVLTRLQKLYPDKDIRIIPEQSCNILAFAVAGEAELIPDPESNGTPFGPMQWMRYIPPDSRVDGDTGSVGSVVLFGKYKLKWHGETFILYIVDGRDGVSSYPSVRNNYIIASTPSIANSLILAVGSYGVVLHNEIWVFDGGYWSKSTKLWSSIQKSKWDNVILDPGMKSSIIKDINRFFDGQDTYRRFQVPWKRGLIFYGPPGNGKTISIKATMHMLYQRQDPVPTLYVKTLSR